MSKTRTPLTESQLRSRCTKARYDILRRAKPKLWKSGRRAGMVRTPGIEALEFTTADLWARAQAQIGRSAIRCPYCVAIGRNANVITLANYVWDHRVPVTHGGGHALDNLFAVCEDCNRLKGSMSYEFFVAMLSEVETWPNVQDRKYVHACLRTHGKVVKGFTKVQPKAEANDVLA